MKSTSRNIELKARLHSWDEARRIAGRLASDALPDQHQVDTYFCCQTGRLKLREIAHVGSELIWYQRRNQAGSKPSDYRILPIADGAALKQILATSLGVLVVVDKRREIRLYENVRIHLDQVAGLGNFIEFEAVLRGEQADAEGHSLVAQLQRAFALRPEDLLEGSYSDMLLAARSPADRGEFESESEGWRHLP